MNLIGLQKGYYTYVKDYPHGIIGKSEPFEFEINDENGLFKGTCVDEVVKAITGNESFVYGIFKEGIIKFKKTYKYYATLNEFGEIVFENKVTMSGVDYEGKLFKRFFSGKPYFKGKWSIAGEYTDTLYGTVTFKSEGAQKMSRISQYFIPPTHTRSEHPVVFLYESLASLFPVLSFFPMPAANVPYKLYQLPFYLWSQ